LRNALACARTHTSDADAQQRITPSQSTSRLLLKLLLFTEAPGIVSKKVKDLQDQYQQVINDNQGTINTSAAAYSAIQRYGYYSLCLLNRSKAYYSRRLRVQMRLQPVRAAQRAPLQILRASSLLPDRFRTSHRASRCSEPVNVCRLYRSWSLNGLFAVTGLRCTFRVEQFLMLVTGCSIAIEISLSGDN
jgi:hypothetical protein